MSSEKRILIIKGSSQYDVLRYVCDELEKSFVELGCTTANLDLTQFSYDNIDKDLFLHYDMIFSFDAIGIDLYNMMNNKPLFWTFLVDPPFYLHERLKQIKGDVMVSCIDRHHVDYIDKYYKNIPYTCFMPHGGMVGETKSIIPFDRRDYKVSFIGSLGRLDVIKDVINSLRDEFGDFVDEVIDNVMSDMDIDLEDAIYSKLTEYNIDFDDIAYKELVYAFRAVDALRRYFKRYALISSLIESGVSVDIWGNGWDQLSDNNYYGKLLNLHGMANYLETQNIMRNSCFILCDMPLFHDGSHERIFASMQTGAIAVTDRSIFLEENFTDRNNLIFYDANDIASLVSEITEIHKNSILASRIIENAQNSSVEHTWKHRAAEILEMVRNIRE